VLRDPLCAQRPFMCMFVIPAVSYLLLDLQDVQWIVGNNRGARKLARTPHVNKKKKKKANPPPPPPVTRTLFKLIISGDRLYLAPQHLLDSRVSIIARLEHRSIWRTIKERIKEKTCLSFSKKSSLIAIATPCHICPTWTWRETKAFFMLCSHTWIILGG